MCLNQNGKELTKNNLLSWIIYPKHHLMSELPNLMFRRYFWTSSIQNNLEVALNRKMNGPLNLKWSVPVKKVRLKRVGPEFLANSRFWADILSKNYITMLYKNQ